MIRGRSLYLAECLVSNIAHERSLAMPVAGMRVRPILLVPKADGIMIAGRRRDIGIELVK